MLLAAFARHQGHPARVVTGLILVRDASKTIAMGHAWVEIHDGNQWRPADAALSKSELARAGVPAHLDYLPIQVVSREDAGFRAGLVSDVGVLQVVSVRVAR